MNKKGFTLVELLAVITLVAIIGGLAVPNVLSSINNNKKNSFLLDAKRMVAKAEYLISKNRSDREEAKTSGIIYSYDDLNADGEFNTNSDGGTYDSDTFVKVTFSNNTFNYCICVVTDKRIIGYDCNVSSGTGCELSTNLTSIDKVKDNN